MKIDKKLHLLVGLAMGLALPMITPYWMSIIITGVVGCGKELYDKWSGKGTPESADAWFTVLGGLIGVVYMYLTK